MSKGSFMDAVREDMQVVGENRLKWKTMICCGEP